MTPLFIVWLFLVGASVGVAATLTVQWWKARGRWRRIELDDDTARLRALDRQDDDWLPRSAGLLRARANEARDQREDEYLMEHLRKANREGWL